MPLTHRGSQTHPQRLVVFNKLAALRLFRHNLLVLEWHNSREYLCQYTKSNLGREIAVPETEEEAETERLMQQEKAAHFNGRDYVNHATPVWQRL